VDTREAEARADSIGIECQRTVEISLGLLKAPAQPSGQLTIHAATTNQCSDMVGIDLQRALQAPIELERIEQIRDRTLHRHDSSEVGEGRIMGISVVRIQLDCLLR